MNIDPFLSYEIYSPFFILLRSRGSLLFSKRGIHWFLFHIRLWAALFFTEPSLPNLAFLPLRMELTGIELKRIVYLKPLESL